MKNSKVKELKKFMKWFFTNTDNTEENLKEFGSLYALVERLQYRIEDLENEHMLMIKDMSKVMDALEERINILNEECQESCTKN